MNGKDRVKTEPPLKIDDETLIGLLEEMAAMARSGRPWTAGLSVLGKEPLGPLRKAALQIQRGLQNGNSADQAFSSLSSRYDTMTQASLRILEERGSGEILSSLVRWIRRWNQHCQQARLHLLYPLLLFVLAVVIGSLVVPQLILTIDSTELSQFKFSDRSIQFSQSLVQGGWVALVGIAMFVSFLIWRRGGKPPRLNSRSPSFWECWCSHVALLMEIGIPLPKAIRSAVESMGQENDLDQWTPLLKGLESGGEPTKMSWPDPTPAPVVRAFDQRRVADFDSNEGNSATNTIEALLAYARLCAVDSWKKQLFWGHRFPMAFFLFGTTAIISAIGLVYVVPLLQGIANSLHPPSMIFNLSFPLRHGG